MSAIAAAVEHIVAAVAADRVEVALVLAAIPDDDLLAILEERGVLVREHAFSIVDTQLVEKARMARYVSAPRQV